MSDNEDLLGDDLEDHSLADYNLGNEEEEQLLADDYDGGPSQNVPTATAYRESRELVPTEYSSAALEYTQPQYVIPDSESVVPNIILEVPNKQKYTPYRETFEEHAVPPAIPAAPAESPQIVPSEAPEEPIVENQERKAEVRPQRSALPRNIPDTLDKVFVPNFPGRGRTWRNPNRLYKPYRRYNFRGNFNPRPTFPAPTRSQNINPIRPEIPEIRPEMARMGPEMGRMGPEMARMGQDMPRMGQDMPRMGQDMPRMAPEMPPMGPEMARMGPDMPRMGPEMPPMGPEISPERPMLPQELPTDRQYNQNFQRFQYRANIDNRSEFANIRANPGQIFYQRPAYNPSFQMREIINQNQVPQVTIRQPMPMQISLKEREVRMLPVPLPPNLPPNLPPGKKVLINPHFKGTFQPPAEGLAYIPTRISKTPPPLSPTLEAKFGPSLPVDEAAERFIAEQRQALARAAARNKEPMRFIENTTIEIENELARCSRRSDDDLLRRQEEFINANRAGLRRRMRSPSPRRSPERERSPDRRRSDEQDSEYRRRVREQETLRERVLRAKEVRRRKNAVALQRRLSEKEREQEKEIKPEEKRETKQATVTEQNIPDTTRKTPEKMEKTEKDIQVEKIERDRSAVKVERTEANSTCDTLTSPPQTPPLPRDSDDEVDLILDDIDDILSDEDSGRFKEKNKVEVPKPPQVDLRSKLPPRETKPRQKIVFNKEEKKEKSPIRRTILTGANKNNISEKKDNKTEKVRKPKSETTGAPVKRRQKIIYSEKLAQKTAKDKKESAKLKSQFTNRRVILQRKVQQSDKAPSRIQPSEKAFSRLQPGGIFSRAVTAIGSTNQNIEFDSSEDDIEKSYGGLTAVVGNLPYGMTDTRLKTLAGDVQNLILDKEDRSARITFRNLSEAEAFRKKFNNKMVAASRISVTLK